MNKADTKNDALPAVNKEAKPISATQGGIFALEPRPTVCHESAYIPNKSKALDGVSGSAPPTMFPKRLREAIKVSITTKRDIERIGRLKSQVIGDGALTKSISASSRASSFKSKTDVDFVEAAPSSYKELLRQARETAPLARSIASCN